MTTRSRPPIGPQLSLVDGAGRSSEWTRYVTGQSIGCPGLRADRRGRDALSRGPDRREHQRFSPCSHTWGRVPAGAITDVRVHKHGTPYAPPPSLLLFCQKCQSTVEFKTHAANEAA